MRPSPAASRSTDATRSRSASEARSSRGGSGSGRFDMPSSVVDRAGHPRPSRTVALDNATSRGVSMKDLADELMAVYFDAHPLAATINGIRDREEGLTDYSEAGEEAFAATVAGIADRARAVDPDTLGADDRITRAVLLATVEQMRTRIAARGVEYAITDTWTANGPDLLINIPMIGLTEPAHADGYLARLGAIPRALEQIADRHRAGIAAGRVPVRRLVEATVAFFDRYLGNRAGDPLCRPAAPGSSAGFDASRDRVIDDVVRPAIAR